MSKIKNKFLELKSKNQKALIAYVVAGYPSEKDTLSTIRGLVKGGADIIELGLPFSDPLADGPVIQNASYIALQKGINFSKFLSLVKKIRKDDSIYSYVPKIDFKFLRYFDFLRFMQNLFYIWK